jgi:hypothetical protein
MQRKEIKGLKATIWVAMATAGLAFAAPAQAPTFDFSVTNTTGDYPGIFTGQIFGLSDNSTAPSEVVVDTVPPGYRPSFNSPLTYPPDTIAFVDPNHNSFTVTNGQITLADYSADKGNGPSTNPGGGFELQRMTLGPAFDFDVEENGSSARALHLGYDDPGLRWPRPHGVSTEDRAVSGLISSLYYNRADAIFLIGAARVPIGAGRIDGPRHSDGFFIWPM